MLKRRTADRKSGGGVHVELDDLLRLQAKASGFSFLPRQPIHSILAGRHASRLRGRGLNFEEIRSYVPGDDIRNMDWKVTARIRKPHVRVYTEERDRPVILVVDQRISMFFGSQRCMKAVTAAEAAALGAWRVLGVGDRVGAIVFDDNEIVEIKPHRSRSRVIEILKTVTDFNHRLSADSPSRTNPDMFNEVLIRARRLASHDHLICLIGDARGAGEKDVREVTLLNEHNDVLALFIYDPLEAELPDRRKLVITDGDKQLQVDTAKAGLQRKYKNDFDERLAFLGNISRLRQIPLIPISTAEGTADQVQRRLGFVPKGA
jgi:uncharacterized protein (DUF58 family)